MVIFQSLDKKIPSSHEISLDHGSKAVRRSLVILCKAVLIYGVNQMVVTIKKGCLSYGIFIKTGITSRTIDVAYVKHNVTVFLLN